MVDKDVEAAFPLRLKLTILITSLSVGTLVMSNTRWTPLKIRSFGRSSKIIRSMTLRLVTLSAGWRRGSSCRSAGAQDLGTQGGGGILVQWWIQSIRHLWVRGVHEAPVCAHRQSKECRFGFPEPKEEKRKTLKLWCLRPPRGGSFKDNLCMNH